MAARAPVHLALAAAALAAATGLAASRLSLERERPYDVAVIPSAPAVRWLSLGHATTAANAFWLRTVQYIGEPRASERGWEKLLPLAELVTDLDPRHGYAYQVAGVILGSVGRPAESDRILEKGMRNVPERYVLPLLRAFNAFYYEDDWPAAGRFAEQAARAPGAPEHLRQTVLAYYVKGKRADAALAFLTQARTEVRDDESRKAIDEQIRQARLEVAAAEVEEAVARYRAARGVGPLWLGRLVAEGFLAALPADPFGGRLSLDPEGRVRSTAHPFRFQTPPPGSLRAEPGLDPLRHQGRLP